MSVSYISYAIIGVKVDIDKIFPIRNSRTCDCDVDLSGNFCSQCGSKLFEKKIEYIEGFDKTKNILHGYKVVFGTDDEDPIIAAKYVKNSNWDSPSFEQIPTDIADVKNKMRDLFGPLGLWDEKKFGLWSVLYCSY